MLDEYDKPRLFRFIALVIIGYIVGAVLIYCIFNVFYDAHREGCQMIIGMFELFYLAGVFWETMLYKDMKWAAFWALLAGTNFLIFASLEEDQFMQQLWVWLWQ